MAAKAIQFTVPAVATRLSQALTDKTVGGAEDIPYRQLLLQATGGAVFVGSTSGVTITTWGLKIQVDAATGVPPTPLGPFETGPIKLSDLWVISTAGTEVLHILGIPF